jgi:fumarate reductase subunit D
MTVLYAVDLAPGNAGIRAPAQSMCAFLRQRCSRYFILLLSVLEYWPNRHSIVYEFIEHKILFSIIVPAPIILQFDAAAVAARSVITLRYELNQKN